MSWQPGWLALLVPAAWLAWSSDGLAQLKRTQWLRPDCTSWATSDDTHPSLPSPPAGAPLVMPVRDDNGTVVGDYVVGLTSGRLCEPGNATWAYYTDLSNKVRPAI